MRASEVAADDVRLDALPRPGLWAAKEAARALLAYTHLEHPAHLTDTKLLSRLRVLDELPLEVRIRPVADAAERNRVRPVTTLQLPPPAVCPWPMSWHVARRPLWIVITPTGEVIARFSAGGTIKVTWVSLDGAACRPDVSEDK